MVESTGERKGQNPFSVGGVPTQHSKGEGGLNSTRIRRLKGRRCRDFRLETHPYLTVICFDFYQDTRAVQGGWVGEEG